MSFHTEKKERKKDSTVFLILTTDHDMLEVHTCNMFHSIQGRSSSVSSNSPIHWSSFVSYHKSPIDITIGVVSADYRTCWIVYLPRSRLCSSSFDLVPSVLRTHTSRLSMAVIRALSKKRTNTVDSHYKGH